MKKLSLVALLLLTSTPAMAYIGPGLGMGAIGTIFGILVAIVLAVFGLFWYPMKRALTKKKNAARPTQSSAKTAQNIPTLHSMNATSQQPDMPEKTPNGNTNDVVSKKSTRPAESSSSRTPRKQTRFKKRTESEVT